MAHYCLVHISDIHTKNNADEILKLFERAATATIIEGIGQTKTLVVLMTGDLAYSGKKEEYEVLQRGIDRFKTVVSTKGFTSRFLFVPGNHDCDFKSPNAPIRNLLVQNVAPSLSRNSTQDKSVFETFLETQVEFRNFCKQNGFNVPSDSLVHSVHLEDLSLNINFLNTAWASELNENDNRPFVLSEFDKLKLLPANLNVSLFHHPKSWIDKSIVGAFAKSVGDAADFIFTGHEHASNSYEVSYTNGEAQTYFEAGPFCDGKGSSQFRVLIVNKPEKNYSVLDFTWNQATEVYEKKAYHDLKFPETPQANALGLLIDQSFSKFLRDPEIPIKHSLTRELELRDLYIFPRLIANQGLVSENGVAKVISSEPDFCDLLWDKKICLVVGNDKSGKTALCKRSFEMTFASGALAVYVSGEELQSSSDVVIKNLISEKLKKQYRGCKGIEVLQNPDLKSVLIIDRFDQIPLSPRKVGEMLSIVTNLFSAVLMTADSSIEIQLLNDPRLGMPIDDIARLQIGQLTAGQRRDLIIKWLNLGNVYKGETSESSIHQLELFISSVVSEYGIPSYPLFILTYLEIADVGGNSSNLNISSNAKLLETLVNISLMKIADSTNSSQTQIAYLRELAFHFHILGKNKLTSDEIRKFHTEYCAKLDVVLNQDQIWFELCDAKILLFDGDTGCFKYPYFRSFFMAGYLNFYSTNISTKELIKQTIENIHVSENASILATLSLYSAEMWVFDELRKKLDETIKSETVRGFAEIGEVIERITQNKDFPLLPDDQENSHHEVDTPPIKEEPKIELTEPVFQLSQAIRLIKVLGQLIRNSANTLDGPRKKELIESIFNAAGRILAVQSTALENGKDEILVYIFHRLREKNPSLSETEAKIEATHRIAFLLSGSAIGLIDVVSRSIGDEFLDPTFRKIQSDDKDQKLEYFFLGIHLDWYRSFPKAELLSLFQKAGSKGFRSFLVRYLAFRSMAFRGNDLGVPTLQELCSKLEVNFKKLQLKLISSTKSTRGD